MILAVTSALYYQLPLLIVLISLVYSATRFDDWNAILRDARWWVVKIAVFLGAIGLILYAVASFL
jgi:hypothetical protein